VTHSHLGGFTSNSNKCHKDCFTKLKCSSHSQRGISQPKLGFLTNHSNLTKRYWGELTKALGMSIFVGGTITLQRREGEAFILAPPKTSCWELANKNQNIRNLNYTRYRQNRTIRFGKPACPVFSGSVRCEVYVATVFHSSPLRFLGYVEH
jgi:hypothetical protein